MSVSKRKTKPAKKGTPKSAAAQAQAAAAVDAALPQIRIDVDGRQEIVDPDEERYCVCGDVSWGEMICCELDEKVWVPALYLPSLDSFRMSKLTCFYNTV